MQRLWQLKAGPVQRHARNFGGTLPTLGSRRVRVCDNSQMHQAMSGLTAAKVSGTLPSCHSLYIHLAEDPTGTAPPHFVLWSFDAALQRVTLFDPLPNPAATAPGPSSSAPTQPPAPVDPRPWEAALESVWSVARRALGVSRCYLGTQQHSWSCGYDVLQLANCVREASAALPCQTSPHSKQALR